MEDLPQLVENSEIIMYNNHGNVCGKIQYLDNMPVHSEKISKEGLQQLQLLVGESFKSIATVPNKTLEIFFKPEIAKGLEDGSLELMRTSEGKEILADAVKSGTHKIAGKARVKTNISKQITAAGFQLISFAVAQSHLSDINTRLSKIEALCEDLKKDNENKAVGELKGDISYLEGIIKKIEGFSSPESISNIQKVNIEIRISNFYKYQDTFITELNGLLKSINEQKNSDNFGTENTYNELLRKQERYDDFILRMELMNKIYILLKTILGYIDPFLKDFSSIGKESFFDELEKLHIKYNEYIRNKSDELLKSTFNAKDTLELRKSYIELKMKIQDSLCERINNNRNDVLCRLSSHLTQLTNSNKIRYALKFDSQGKIEEASLI